ncbi:putative RTA-like protein [Acrodontium crateriforme]|uniref:RTA-like protein n=1 Tax=Acrodontium crateriforme TaxID=150365 RepID=A0AAQ3M4K5_9PEZI|nr:putative RTA-like protein [Acrodontium crateriforme]
MTTENDNWSLYPYHPVTALPPLFAIVIFGLGATLIYLSFFKHRWTKFGIMMTWASSVWVAGFICRSISIYDQQNVGMFIAQFVLVLMGPPLYAAAEYFILGRLFAYLPYHTPIHPGRVLSTFFMLSVIVESLTANGAANSSGTGRSESQIKNGLACLKAALIIQTCIEVFFFSLVALLEHRCRRAKKFPQNVRMVCYTLYVTSFMMFVRCIIRTIEGFNAAACNRNAPDYDGYCGYISRHEWCLYLFEIANITVFVMLLTVFHPGRYLPRDTNVFLDPVDGQTERVGPGFSSADARPLWMTIIDPFNFHGILTGRGMVMRQFWDEPQPVYERGSDIPLKRRSRSRSTDGQSLVK